MVYKMPGNHGRESVRKAQDMMVVFTIKKFRLSHGVKAVCSQRPGACTRHSTNWFPKKGFQSSSQKGLKNGTGLTGILRLEVPISTARAPAGLEEDFGPSLAEEVGCSGDAYHIHARDSFIDEHFQPHTQNECYFITQVLPTREDIKA